MSRCSTCQVLVYFVASYLYEVVRLKSKNGFSFEDALETLQSEYVSHYEKACMCEPGTSPETICLFFRFVDAQNGRINFIQSNSNHNASRLRGILLIKVKNL